MSQALFGSTVYLITTLFLFLTACSAAVENRASSPARIPSRRPPFNGSMFGKRSLLPVLSRPNYGGKDTVVANKPSIRDTEEYDLSENPVEKSALEIVRDEPLIRASLDQCIQLQRSLDREQDPVIATLCSELLNDSRTLQENNLWFKQLIGLDKGYK